MYVADNSLSIKVWMSPAKSKEGLVPTAVCNVTVQQHSTNLCSIGYNCTPHFCATYLALLLTALLYLNSEFTLEYYEEHNRVWVKIEELAV